MALQKITPFLWFDSQAEEAANFYASIFPNAKVNKVLRYTDAGPGPVGSAMTVEFTLEGLTFVALNGGPVYKLNPAVSFVVHCETQEEIDHYWSKLSAGGMEVQCGWLTDKFGLSWQIVPTVFFKLISDPQRSAHVMKAMFGMKKLDIQGLQDAFDNAV